MHQQHGTPYEAVAPLPDNGFSRFSASVVRTRQTNDGTSDSVSVTLSDLKLPMPSDDDDAAGRSAK
jgi:hypothetical protein